MVHFEPAAETLSAGLPGKAAARRQAFKEFAPAISALRTGETEEAALKFIEGVFKLPDGGAADLRAPWLAMIRDNARTVAPFLAMDPPPPLSCEDLGTVESPTLVVQGQDTFVRYSMMAEKLARCQANAVPVTMPEVNHDGPYRKPDEFAALIESFLGIVEIGQGD